MQGKTYWRYTTSHEYLYNPWQELTDDAREVLGYVKTTRLSPNYEDCPALHAEANGLSRSNHIYRNGGTIYVTSDVCHACAKLVANSGLIRVVVDQRVPREYRNSSESYEFLKTCGLEVVLIV
jgi:deoxycytidylate deaminase